MLVCVFESNCGRQRKVGTSPTQKNQKDNINGLKNCKSFFRRDQTVVNAGLKSTMLYPVYVGAIYSQIVLRVFCTNVKGAVVKVCLPAFSPHT